MKKMLFSPVGLIIAHIIAAGLNFAYAISGSSDFKWILFGVTLLYIGYWFLFIAIGNLTKIGIIMYSVMIVVSVAGAIIAKNALIADWFIPIAVVFGTPFAGLGAVFRNWHWWGVMIIISILMIILSVIKNRRNASAIATSDYSTDKGTSL